MRTAAVVCLVSATALLTACSKPSAPGQTGVAQSAAAAASGPAALFARPHPKAGLWRMTMSVNAGPGIRMGGDLCLDAKTEQSAFTASRQSRPKDCPEPTFSSGPGGTVVFDDTCHTDGRTITMHGVASGDFSSAYTTDLTTRMDPAPPGAPAEVKTHMEAQWIGPCKPGQAPGHMSMKMKGMG